MKIAIFDLQFANYIYHSAPRPSMYTMLISGYHKTKGHAVSLLWKVPDFGSFDIVYINKDDYDLFHDPSWLTYENVKCVGGFWGEIDTFYNEDWEEAMPDLQIYKGWTEMMQEKYSTYSDKKLELFTKYKPVKIKQKNRITSPEGENLLIIDNDMHIWDKDCKILQELNINKSVILYPFELDGRWDAVLEAVACRHLRRDKMWANMNIENYNDESIQDAIDIWNKYKIGRMFRIKLHVKGEVSSDWESLIPTALKVMKEFRMQSKKRLFFTPHQMETFSHPRILMEMKRWSGKDMGYAKNSVFDYILYDGIRDINKIIEFLEEPYEYVNKKKHGTNKLIEVLDFIETYPELIEYITESYPQGAG